MQFKNTFGRLEKLFIIVLVAVKKLQSIKNAVRQN